MKKLTLVIIYLCTLCTSFTFAQGDGKVGIGTTNPVGDLHIQGTQIAAPNTEQTNATLLLGHPQFPDCIGRFGYFCRRTNGIPNGSYDVIRFMNLEYDGEIFNKLSPTYDAWVDGPCIGDNFTNSGFNIGHVPRGEVGTVNPVSRFFIDDNGNVGLGTTEPTERLQILNTPQETTIAIGQTPNNINGQIRTLCIDGLSDRIDVDINVAFDPQSGFSRQNPEFNSWCNSMNTTPGGQNSSFGIAYAAPGSGNIEWQNYLKINEIGNVGLGTDNPTERLQIVNTPQETTIAIGQTPNNINGQIRTLCIDELSDRIDVDINVDFDPQFGFIRQNPEFSSWCNSMNTTLGGDNSSFDIAYATPGSGNIEWQSFMNIDQSGNMNVMGDVRAQNFTVISDSRFKENINNLENALEKVKQLRSVSYTFNQAGFPKKNFTDKQQIGFIAQEIQKVFPDLVKEDKEGYLAVNYTSLVPVLTEAIKELDAENSSIKQQNEALQQQVKSLEKRMEQIELLLQKK